MRRRDFLAAVGGAGISGCGAPEETTDLHASTPKYLVAHQEDYQVDPRRAAGQWFRDAGCGLLLRYGVYSQLGKGPNVQFDERIPLQQYSRLGASFDPSGFDAERIADLALRCGFRYLGLPARHADGFCLFRTIESDFNSLEAAGHDLLGDLAVACHQRGIALFASYSYAADWRHPYFFPPETSLTGWRGARPPYGSIPEEYKFSADEDFLAYARYAHNQLQEIVYRYEPVAGVWFEPLDGYRARPDLLPVGQAYSVLRSAQPALLLAFGEGANGDEDFVSLDCQAGQPSSSCPGGGDPRQSADLKPIELGIDLVRQTGERRNGPELFQLLRAAADQGANLLLRADLQPDGALHPDDERSFLELARLRRA